jgi:hypothetical protein
MTDMHAASNRLIATHIEIRLTGADLYMMEFLRIRAGVVKTVSISDGIYAEDLQPEFTRGTGLDTRL